MKLSFIRAIFLSFAALVPLSLVSAYPVAAKTVSARHSAVKKKTIHRRRRYAASGLYIRGRIYKDEHTDPKNNKTRCLTPTMQRLHNASLAQARLDGEHYQVTPTTKSAIGNVYRKYLTGIATAWSALQAPYCGFGYGGVSAVAHSYEKTMSHLRTQFQHDAARAGH